jgi:hypothetical protein
MSGIIRVFASILYNKIMKIFSLRAKCFDVTMAIGIPRIYIFGHLKKVA